MEYTPAEAIDAIERSLERRVTEMSTETEGQGPPVDGVQRLIDVLVRSNKEIEKQVVEALALHDEALAEEVRAKLFVFEDIVTLDDRAVQQILRQVDSRELAIAMKGVESAVASKVTSNMSSAAEKPPRRDRGAASTEEGADRRGPNRDREDHPQPRRGRRHRDQPDER